MANAKKLVKVGVQLSKLLGKTTPDLPEKLMEQFGAYSCGAMEWDTVRSKYGKREVPAFWRQAVLAGPELSRLALALLSLTPSEASVERAFSALKHVQGDLRTNLGEKTLKALMFLRQNHSLLELNSSEEGASSSSIARGLFFTPISVSSQSQDSDEVL